MKKSKGMTLLELLIAMGISVLIMAATFVIIQFSVATYDNTLGMVEANNNTYDAANIINHYIRTSSYCALSDDGNGIFVTVDDSGFGGTEGNKHTISIVLDTEEDVLFIDRMDGSAKMVVSRNIKRVEWEVKDNGVKYIAYGMDGMGKEKIMFFGYACKRGR